MFIINHKKAFFALTGLIVLVSVGAILAFGLHFSVDFTGGTLAEVRYTNGTPQTEELSNTLKNIGIPDVSVRSAGNDGFIIRAGTLTEAMRASLPQAVAINGKHQATLDQVTEVGPTIGTELRNKALVSMVLVILAILLFIAFAFRKVSRPVSSWMYGLMALVTLVHDVIVPVGFFAIMGHYFGAQVDTLFVTAVLTILGYSIHDTIVVFDRVRENLHIAHTHNRHEGFSETVGRSINQTLVRSINTSVTVLISLAVLYFVGPAATKYFALTLIVGIVAGTYSSIALASPLLVAIEEYRRKRA